MRDMSCSVRRFRNAHSRVWVFMILAFLICLLLSACEVSGISGNGSNNGVGNGNTGNCNGVNNCNTTNNTGSGGSISTPASGSVSTPTPPSPPAPSFKPGDILYQADWSSGLGGWTQSGGWSSINGMLVNDGLAYDGDGNPTAIAPGLPQAVADYSVQTEIRLDRYTDEGNLGGEDDFGIVVRSPDDIGGYKVGACVSAGFFSCGTSDHELLLSDGSFSQDTPVKQAPFRPAYGTWHTYRIDVKGNSITVWIDGGIIFQATDDKYLAAGSVGLWSDRSQISVRSFKIVAL